MRQQVQHVVVVGEPDQGRSQQRRDGEVERNRGLPPEQRLRGRLVLDGDLGPRDRGRVRDVHQRFAVGGRRKAHPQAVVPAGEGRDGGSQRGGVEVAAQPYADGQPVGGGAGSELFQEPHALLRERGPHRGVLGQARDRERSTGVLIGLRRAR
jgi:hypothetical protein